jgi:hypothetical protein
VSDRRRTVLGLTLVGYVAWFGGLIRLLGEAGALVLTRSRPEGADASILIGGGAVLAFSAVGLFALLPWYRRFFWQTRRNLAASRGLRPEELPSLGAGLRRRWKAIAVSVGGALLLALILPGLAAAAISVLVGALLRVMGVTLTTHEGAR